MITNLLATIIIVVTTNTYSPVQYKVESGITFLNGQSWEPQWQDEKPWYFDSGYHKARTRENPDLRITEVTEKRTLTFTIEGTTITHILSVRCLSTKKERRQVKSEEKWVEELAVDTNGFRFNTATNYTWQAEGGAR